MVFLYLFYIYLSIFFNLQLYKAMKANWIDFIMEEKTAVFSPFLQKKKIIPALKPKPDSNEPANPQPKPPEPGELPHQEPAST